VILPQWNRGTNLCFYSPAISYPSPQARKFSPSKVNMHSCGPGLSSTKRPSRRTYFLPATGASPTTDGSSGDLLGFSRFPGAAGGADADTAGAFDADDTFATSRRAARAFARLAITAFIFAGLLDRPPRRAISETVIGLPDNSQGGACRVFAIASAPPRGHSCLS
jgi:hypothetical protein